MKKFLYYLLQFTWGILGNIVGFIIWLVFAENPHSIYKGSFQTRIDKDWGLGIGNFTFVSDDSQFSANHEHGHNVQNIIWGPLWFFVIGIPSVIRYWKCKIKDNFIGYYNGWPENNANRLGGN